MEIGTHVCAALTGGRIIADPFFDKNPISLYIRFNGRETLNRRSAHHKHKIAKGSNPTGGGTAATNLTSRMGGMELRLIYFWDLSRAPPTNRNTHRSKIQRLDTLKICSAPFFTDYDRAEHRRRTSLAGYESLLHDAGRYLYRGE